MQFGRWDLLLLTGYLHTRDDAGFKLILFTNRGPKEVLIFAHNRQFDAYMGLSGYSEEGPTE